MDPDIVSFFQVCAGVLMLVGGLTTIAISARVILLRAQRSAPQIDEKRMQHLEQAIDAIAIEVERISEGQRYTTKLLADRDRDSSLH